MNNFSDQKATTAYVSSKMLKKKKKILGLDMSQKEKVESFIEEIKSAGNKTSTLMWVVKENGSIENILENGT
jgi:hypothetical protein